ncbi:unnamed protein product [Knipowitschia caucasica]
MARIGTSERRAGTYCEGQNLDFWNEWGRFYCMLWNKSQPAKSANQGPVDDLNLWRDSPSSRFDHLQLQASFQTALIKASAV